MSWIAITEDHVADRLSSPEFAAYTGAYLRPGKTSPLPGIITGVTNEVRGYVAGNTSNSLQDGEVIPSELLDAACAIIITRLIARLPVKLSDARKEAKNDALKLLDRVASNRFFVSAADTDDLSDDQPAKSIEYFTGEGHDPTSTDLDGLI